MSEREVATAPPAGSALERQIGNAEALAGRVELLQSRLNNMLEKLKGPTSVTAVDEDKKKAETGMIAVLETHVDRSLAAVEDCIEIVNAIDDYV